MRIEIYGAAARESLRGGACILRAAVCILLFARRADYLNSTFRTAEAVAEARYLSSLANNTSP